MSNMLPSPGGGISVSSDDSGDFSVYPYDGSFQYTVTDLTIPGRGFDWSSSGSIAAMSPRPARWVTTGISTMTASLVPVT